jgi:hypothetical protein
MTHMTDGIEPHQIQLTITVDIDPVAHGFDVSVSELEEAVLRAINAAPGLEVSAVTS